MKSGFKTAIKFYKFFVIAFTTIFFMYLIIDDWVFIEKYGATHWFEYLTTWLLWYLVYLLGCSVYYWFIASTLVLIYYKIYLPRKFK